MQSPVERMYDVIEEVGEMDLIYEWIRYSTHEDLEKFIKHCSGVWELQELQELQELSSPVSGA
jgi:hypothetical protein